MSTEYNVVIGLDGTPFSRGVMEQTKHLSELDSVARKTTASVTKNFAEIGKGVSSWVSEAAKGTRVMNEQAALAKELSAIYSTYAAAASRANDSAPIKKYAEEFKKLADLANKTKTFSLQFDDADLILFNGVLQRTQGELSGLSALLEVLKPKLASLDPNSEEFKLLNEQVAVSEKLIKEFNGEFDNTAQKAKSLRTELKELKQQLALMEEQGLDNTRQFEEMAIRAGEVEDQIGDTSARIKVLASDTKYIDATIQAVSTLTAGFGLVQGAQALFGEENKELNETLQKLQAVMVIINSLQQIQNVLQKQSTLNVVASSVARAANTAAIVTETAATGAQTVATTAANTATKGFWATLAANPIGWILAAVGGLIAILSSLKDKFDLNKTVEQDLNAIRGESLKSIKDEELELHALVLVAQDETKSKKERKQAIDAINEKMPEYNNNISIENINTKAVSDQITNYINQLQKKALAQAYISKIQDLYSKLIDAESASLEDNIKWYQTLWIAIKSGGNIENSAINTTKAAIKNRQENIDNINQEINALQGKFDADIKSGKAVIDVNEKTKKSNKEASKAAEEYQRALLKLQSQYVDSKISLMQSERDQAKAQAVQKYKEDVASIFRISL